LAGGFIGWSGSDMGIPTPANFLLEWIGLFFFMVSPDAGRKRTGFKRHDGFHTATFRFYTSGTILRLPVGGCNKLLCKLQRVDAGLSCGLLC